MTARPKSMYSIQSSFVCVVIAGLSALSASAWGKPTSETTPRSPDAATGTSGVHSVSTDMVPIMALLRNHEKIRFTLLPIPWGERTITTSTDPQITQTIRLHAREMKARVQQGDNIRPHDPIFIEIFRHHREIHDVITDIPGGVTEEETSQNPQVVLLIRAHAQAVAGFARQGIAATRRNTPLPKGYHLPPRDPADVGNASR